jgi:hypothetical protein
VSGDPLDPTTEVLGDAELTIFGETYPFFVVSPVPPLPLPRRTPGATLLAPPAPRPRRPWLDVRNQQVENG